MFLQISFANVLFLIRLSYANSSDTTLKPCDYVDSDQWFKDLIPNGYKKLNIPPLPENASKFPVKGTVLILGHHGQPWI